MPYAQWGALDGNLMLIPNAVNCLACAITKPSNVCVCVCVRACVRACMRAGEGRGATITDRYVHQSVECQYKSQFLVAEGKCMTWY